jgi:MscS family membrane protein
MAGIDENEEQRGEKNVVRFLGEEKNHETDAPNNAKTLRNLVKPIIQDAVVLPIIVINAIIFIALDINPDLILKTGAWLGWVDYACVLFFFFELFIKVYLYGLKSYIKHGWFNRLDLIIVIASIPIILEPLIPNLSQNSEWVPIFRIARLLRVSRFLRSARLIHYLRRDGLDSFKYPCYFILTISLTNIIIVLFEFSGSWKVWYDKFYGPSLLFVSTWLISRVYKLIHKVFIKTYFDKQDKGVNGALEPVISAVIQTLIWAIGISLTIEMAGYDSTSILAGLGLGGMALALAAQDSIGNLIGGILLYINKSFKIGDQIEIDNMKGAVTKAGLRNINIVDVMGATIVLPNKMFMSKPFKNNTDIEFLSGSISLKLNIKLSAFKLEQAIDLISDIAIDYEHIHDEYTLSFGDMSDYCHNVKFSYLLNKKSLKQSNPGQPNYILITNANKYLYVKIVEKLISNNITFYSKSLGLVSPQSASD